MRADHWLSILLLMLLPLDFAACEAAVSVLSDTPSLSARTSALTLPDDPDRMLNHMVEYQPALLDGVYKAISHRVRRELIDRLGRAREGLRVTELAAPHKMSLAAVSKHIRVLEESGLVRRSVVGREHFLTLEGQPLEVAANWIGHYQKFWTERLDLLETRLRETQS